ncbi:cytochrome d ubiquinol oxidase subunit II [Chitinophagales bacterium]|nr:cytochrome d ubiquinol oxidase subunit II [Chitinophagales bacterium]
MIYTELVMIVLGISLVLYMILGGADFGAGIIEIFTGSKGNSTISKAIAPVWEANHMWLIIAIVILFNGFPKAYVILSTNLHIPVLIFLLAIVLRGTAFTFRHYDAYHDESQVLYSYIFRYSSLIAVFFLGITLSAFFGGTIPSSSSGSFTELYIDPWFNLFSMSVGAFLVTLSAYIAAIFLLGEVTTKEGYALLSKFSKRLFFLSAISGIAIFISSYLNDLVFHTVFIQHELSIAAAVLVTLLVPLVFKLIKQNKTWHLRILVGLQITLIMTGWFINQWPNLVVFSDGTNLSMYDAASPVITMKILFIALAVGVLFIFPGLYYLFSLFKSDDRSLKIENPN